MNGFQIILQEMGKTLKTYTPSNEMQPNGTYIDGEITIFQGKIEAKTSDNYGGEFANQEGDAVLFTDADLKNGDIVIDNELNLKYKILETKYYRASGELAVMNHQAYLLKKSQ